MRLRLAQRRTRADKRIRWGGWANGRWRRRPKGFKSDPGPSSPVNYSFFLRKEKIGAPHFKTMRNLLVKLLWVAPAPPQFRHVGATTHDHAHFCVPITPPRRPWTAFLVLLNPLLASSNLIHSVNLNLQRVLQRKPFHPPICK